MLASVVSNPKLHTYVAINARYRSLTYFIVHAIYFVGAGEIHSVARVQAVDYVVSVACSAVSVPISACLPFPCTYCSDALAVAPFALDVKKALRFSRLAFGEHVQMGNRDVWTGSPWGDMWRHDFWGQKMTAAGSHKSFRPLTTLTFRYLLSMFYQRQSKVKLGGVAWY